MAALSRRYVQLVAALTGCVNKTKFMGRESGEILFLGAEGQYRPPTGQTAGGHVVTFSFAETPNLVSPTEPPASWAGDPADWPGIEVAYGQYLPPGQIKEGWDLLEVMLEEAATGGRLLPWPTQFAIHRIFPRADLRKLGFKYLNA